MELLDCYEKLCSCCESSISTNKFYAFSAQTEEKINDLQEQIDNIEASGITYEGGDYIDITDKTISVTGITPNDFASKEDLNELSGKVDTLSATVDTKQDTLVSGINIKTINNTSILGSGNIVISGGGDVDTSLDSGSTNAVANSAITNAITEIEGDIVDVNAALNGKQGTLTSGAFIDISNNVISAKIAVLTKAEWEALTVKDNSVLYLIRQD